MLKSSGSNIAKKTISAQMAARNPGQIAHMARCNDCRFTETLPNASGLRVRAAEPDRRRQTLDDGHGQVPDVGFERHDLPARTNVLQLAGPGAGGGRIEHLG